MKSKYILGMEQPLDESETGQWKSWLKTQHSETTIMAPGPITSWQIDGETKERVTDFILGGSQITADVTAGMKLKDFCSFKENLWLT